jgi:uncharacterized protein YecT (DUF1311 family)
MSAKPFLALLAFILAAAPAAAGLPVETRTLTMEDTKYRIAFAYPRTGHAAIDATIEEWVNARASAFVEEAKDGPTPVGPWWAELEFEVGRNDADAFSVLFVYRTYTAGPHPNRNFEAFHFLMPDGVDVEFAELFTAAGVKRTSDLAIAQLKRDLLGPQQMSDDAWIRNGAGPNARNFCNFVLKRDELVLHFDPYQVAAYVVGEREVRIPRAKLEGAFRADPRLPVASFGCGRARSAVERAICGDRALARLDRHLADAYAQRLSWARTDAQRLKLKHEQRAWLAARDATCAGAEVGCLSRAYAQRVRTLEGR